MEVTFLRDIFIELFILQPFMDHKRTLSVQYVIPGWSDLVCSPLGNIDILKFVIRLGPSFGHVFLIHSILSILWLTFSDLVPL